MQSIAEAVMEQVKKQWLHETHRGQKTLEALALLAAVQAQKEGEKCQN